METERHTPDILNCLANLSSDEVFTSPELANRMLDLLPQELFSNPKTTFLDPCCKSGVFLREIAKRLLKGLETQIPDLQKRIDHIMNKQLFGIALTRLTAEMGRRTLYCAKKADGEYSVATCFKNEQGNLRYMRCEHIWENGKCSRCGANRAQYDRVATIENYAYPFIHKNLTEIFKNMQFDVIIGNPPYQMSDGSGATTDAAMPIYNRFVEQTIKLKPKYMVMIIPSKWMVGGRGLQSFREEMLNDKHIRIMYDFEDASECFSGLHIDGGVCYFLWDYGYNGDTEYTFKSSDGFSKTIQRSLKNDVFEYVIRDARITSIVEKVKKEKKFSEIVSASKPFGVRKYLFNEPERYPESNLSDTPFNNSLKIHGVKGIKGGARRQIGYISPVIVTNGTEWISQYKLFFTTSYSTNAINPPEIIVAGPNEVCTETFLVVGPFESPKKQLNCLSYMQTNFFKVLLYFGKGTMQVTRSVFGLIPLQDFSRPWTDEMLYKKYDLSKDEIAFIESMIRPME